jgi:hypothetical protein
MRIQTSVSAEFNHQIPLCQERSIVLLLERKQLSSGTTWAAESGISEEILNYPAIYPDEETFARLECLGNVGDATEMYSRMWTEVKTE